ncbi:SMC-Scp complex subunit ScpB [Synechococcus moorigangaii CMS01]|jgi:segregation and condensation protein B|nr:SMC-Scp complex subunit ScpB [Synechococcus moorigangaii CMS01]
MSDPIAEAIARLRARQGPQGGDGQAGPHTLAEPSQQALRMAEALLFAAAEPLDAETLAARLPAGTDVPATIARLQEKYANAGVRVTEVGGRWRFETAPDLAHLLAEIREEPKKLSQAALETLSIIAYHQPVTRAEIEEIRGVAVSKGTIDLLFELKWIRLRGRRRSPGRPVTFGTTDTFLEYFGLAAITDLPGLGDLKAAGLLSSRLPANFDIPDPARLADNEDPLDDEDAAHFHLDFLEGAEDEREE